MSQALSRHLLSMLDTRYFLMTVGGVDTAQGRQEVGFTASTATILTLKQLLAVQCT